MLLWCHSQRVRRTGSHQVALDVRPITVWTLVLGSWIAAAGSYLDIIAMHIAPFLRQSALRETTLCVNFTAHELGLDVAQGFLVARVE